MKPWVDRARLVARAQAFTQAYGSFFRDHGKRISALVEVAVYMSYVAFYMKSGYSMTVENLGNNGEFKYRVGPSGLKDNFSFFRGIKDGDAIEIHQNMRMASAHAKHIYFSADVLVAACAGVITKTLKNGRRHSYVTPRKLHSFAEVKHLNPSPELMFSFDGLVLEFLPCFIARTVRSGKKGKHLSPLICFTGPANAHSNRIAATLRKRYRINIVSGTENSNGFIARFSSLLKWGGAR